MKTLKDFIIERANDYSNNSPDHIYIHNKKLIFTNNFANAFIYSTKLDDFLFSPKSATHSDILWGTSNLDKFDKLDKLATQWDGIYSLRFVTGMSQYQDYDDFSQNNPYAKLFKLGRIWIYRKILYITWWDNLSSEEFKKYNQSLIDHIKSNKKFKPFDKVYYMDNNGELLEFNPDNVRSSEVSQERKEILKAQQAIHLATQKEKKEFFKEFRRHRDEANQQKYNHTKSKTEAEWRSIRYQGDSLIDNEKNQIVEKLKINKDTKISNDYNDYEYMYISQFDLELPYLDKEPKEHKDEFLRFDCHDTWFHNSANCWIKIDHLNEYIDKKKLLRLAYLVGKELNSKISIVDICCWVSPIHKDEIPNWYQFASAQRFEKKDWWHPEIVQNNNAIKNPKYNIIINQ